MKIFFAGCILAALVCGRASAQQADADTANKLNHYIGVQANQLIKQIINLNNNNVAISNPYLLTYAVFSSKHKWGVTAGFGYTYRRSKDKLASADQESKINESFYRAGIARKFSVGKRWEASLGLDYIGSYQLDKTFTFSVVEFGNQQKDSTASVSTSVAKISGGGLNLGLTWQVSRRVFLGTEMTLYYSTTNRKSNVLVSDTFTNANFPEQNMYTLSSANTETEDAEFNTTLPVAIFLMIKF
jgi:hypothetical protein